MIGNFQDSFHPFDVSLQEANNTFESREQKNIPSLVDLKSKLLDIFSKELAESMPEKMKVHDSNSLEEDYPDSITLDDGTVVELPDVKKYESINKMDDNGTLYIKDGKLESITIYELNGNVYTTDEQGRIISCDAKPQRSPENPRDIDAQLQAGGQDRRPKDQGGHIVGRDLNGDGGAGNLVAMDSRINQSDYKRMENSVKFALDEGKEVATKTEMTYDGDWQRPDKITVTVVVEGKDTVYEFDNNLDGSLDAKVIEKSPSAKVIMDNYTDAHVSSTKNEYDEEGNLVKTAACITYTDDEGNTCRKLVSI